MFVRRKKNKSGTTSVYVVDTSRGRYQVVKNFGVSRNETEVELLEKRALQYIREATGLSHSIFEKEAADLSGDYIANLSDSQLRAIGPELIYGRLYDKIGFGRLQNEMFRHLVVTRLFSPDSKWQALDYLQRYIGKNYGVNSIYRFLDNLCYRKKERRIVSGKDIKREVEEISFAYTQEKQKACMDDVFCCLIPLRFETGDENSYRKTVFSKQRKRPLPQLYLALLMASGGNPVGYEMFDESVLQDNSFFPLIQRISKRFNLSFPIIIGNTAMLLKKSRIIPEEAHREYIFGMEPKNETEDIRREILSLELKDGEVAVIPQNEDCRLIVFKSTERAAMERQNRERGLKRLQKRIEAGKLSPASINNRGYNKFLKLKGKKKVVIDMDKCKTEAAWDGITLYITNTKLPSEEVMLNVKNLPFIEQAFRMSRSDLYIRPIYRRMQNRIEANLCICFTTYTIMFELERLLKLSGSVITLKEAQKLTYTLYQLAGRQPNSEEIKKRIPNMDKRQAELCRIVKIGCS